MGEKGLMQEETWEEESDDETPLKPTIDKKLLDSLSIDERNKNPNWQVADNPEEPPPSSSSGFSQSDEAALSILFTGIEPDISSEPMDNDKVDHGPVRDGYKVGDGPDTIPTGNENKGNEEEEKDDGDDVQHVEGDFPIAL